MLLDNRDMVEKNDQTRGQIRKGVVKKIIEEYQMGSRFEDEGYEDLGFTIQCIAAEDARHIFPYLTERERIKIEKVMYQN